VSAALASLFLLTAWPAGAQTVVERADGTISVRATDLPLTDVLHAIGNIRPFEKLDVAAAIETTPVTVEIADVSIRAALIAVLDASPGVDYVLSGSANGERLRLVAGKAVTPRTALRTDATPKPSDDAGPPERPTIRKGMADIRQAAESTQTDRPSDPATELVMEHLTQLLTGPQMRPRPGAAMELPFPGPDGQPLLVTPSQVRTAAGSTEPNSSRQSTLIALPSDPGLRDLYSALLTAHRPQE
jgi:hypothetical protein